MNTVVTGSRAEALQQALDRTAQVLEVAYTTAALKAGHPNAELGQVIDGLYPGLSSDVRAEGMQVGKEGSIAQYLNQVISPFFPNGVDPQQVAAVFGKSNILDAFQVDVKKWDVPKREISYTRPPRELEVLFQEINQVPDRRQDGVWSDSRVMNGFKGDIVPAAPEKKTAFVHFDLPELTRDEEKSELKKRGQIHAQPGDLALPVAVNLAHYGWHHEKGNLLRFDGINYVARTEKAETKNGGLVRGLYSDDDGVFANDSRDDLRLPYVVPAGSLNPKA